MKKKIASVPAALAALCWATSAPADIVSPSHRCNPPIESIQRDEYSTRIYQLEVDDYRSCIKHFVDEQNMAIEVHKEAADKAIGDWNSFVEQSSRRR